VTNDYLLVALLSENFFFGIINFTLASNIPFEGFAGSHEAETQLEVT
jgi:hypothetical protein